MIDANNNVPLLRQQYQSFEGIWEKDDNGVEFVSARKLQTLFGYGTWDKFVKVTDKAKAACKNNNINVENHFSHLGKMVPLGSGSMRKIEDIKLTRYACYLIAQNGDPRKSQIAFAQHYFAVQTRRFEKIIERMDKIERLESREKLKVSEKEFGRIAYERGVRKEEFGIIKSKGDEAFYGGKTTQQMKEKLGIPGKRPLHDFTPKTVTLGKALANAITTQNVEAENKNGMHEISAAHVSSNKNVRDALTKSGIYPENVSKEEDIKKVEREITKEDKKLANQVKSRIESK